MLIALRQTGRNLVTASSLTRRRLSLPDQCRIVLTQPADRLRLPPRLGGADEAQALMRSELNASHSATCPAECPQVAAWPDPNSFFT